MATRAIHADGGNGECRAEPAAGETKNQAKGHPRPGRCPFQIREGIQPDPDGGAADDPACDGAER